LDTESADSSLRKGHTNSERGGENNKFAFLFVFFVYFGEKNLEMSEKVIIFAAVFRIVGKIWRKDEDTNL